MSFLIFWLVCSLINVIFLLRIIIKNKINVTLEELLYILVDILLGPIETVFICYKFVKENKDKILYKFK